MELFYLKSNGFYFIGYWNNIAPIYDPDKNKAIEFDIESAKATKDYLERNYKFTNIEIEESNGIKS